MATGFKTMNKEATRVTLNKVLTAIKSSGSGYKNEIGMQEHWEKSLRFNRDDLIAAAVLACFQGASNRTERIGDIDMTKIGSVNDLIRVYIGEVLTTMLEMSGVTWEADGTISGDSAKACIETAAKLGNQISNYRNDALTHVQNLLLFQGSYFIIAKDKVLCKDALIASLYRAKCDLHNGLALDDEFITGRGLAQLSKINSLLNQSQVQFSKAEIANIVRYLPDAVKRGGGVITYQDLGAEDLNGTIGKALKMLENNRDPTTGRARKGQIRLSSNAKINPAIPAASVDMNEQFKQFVLGMTKKSG